MIKNIFKYKKANIAKLKTYGFKKVVDKYQYNTFIFNNQFNMMVFVDESGEVSTKVIDTATGDEYILHLVETSVGEFVGKVRADYERVLTDICNNCFEKEVFKSEQAKQIINYVNNKYNDELEFPWEKFENNAIIRRQDNKKWYLLFVVLPKRKLGLNSDELVEIIDLRIEPGDIEKIVDNKNVFAAYHMNKKRWFTICLNGKVPIETIYKFVDKSYALAKI